MSIGDFPEVLSQRVLVGTILVGRLGVIIINNHNNSNNNNIYISNCSVSSTTSAAPAQRELRPTAAWFLGNVLARSC